MNSIFLAARGTPEAVRIDLTDRAAGRRTRKREMSLSISCRNADDSSSPLAVMVEHRYDCSTRLARAPSFEREIFTAVALTGRQARQPALLRKARKLYQHAPQHGHCIASLESKVRARRASVRKIRVLTLRFSVSCAPLVLFLCKLMLESQCWSYVQITPCLGQRSSTPRISSRAQRLGGGPCFPRCAGRKQAGAKASTASRYQPGQCPVPRRPTKPADLPFHS